MVKLVQEVQEVHGVKEVKEVKGVRGALEVFIPAPPSRSVLSSSYFLFLDDFFSYQSLFGIYFQKIRSATP